MLGHGVKTVDTIQSTFLACDGVRVSSADVLFFDDLIHPKIHDIIPAQNYFHVQPYRRHGDFDNTHNAFLTAFMVKDLDQKLSVMAEYKKVGLSIGNEPEHADSFKAQVPTGKNVNIFDSELIFKRLRKMLRVDMEYKTNYSKVNNVEQPLNKSLTVKMKAKGLFNGGSKRRTMKLRN
jgi:hypothetical protein